MSLTEEAIDRIAALGAAEEKGRVVTLPNGQVILFTSEHSEAGCKNASTTLIEPTKDARGNYLAPPDHIKTDLTIQTADSLVDYAQKFKAAGAILFADIARDRIVAVLDYHTGPVDTAHADHRAILLLPRSEEWKLWSGIADQWMPQLEFARFLRENAADIKAPDAATLLETVKDLQAVRNVNFTKAVRLNSENESFEFTDETKANSKGSVEIPDRFLLEIPVYFGGRYVEVGAFLRWKLEGNQLFLGIQLHRAEHVRQALFKEIVADVSDRADLPAVYAVVS